MYKLERDNSFQADMAGVADAYVQGSPKGGGAWTENHPDG